MNDEQKAEKEQIKHNLQVAGQMQVGYKGLAPRTLEEMKLVAQTFIASGLVPAGFKAPAQVIVALQAGAELGFTPWQALQNLHVVNGKVGIASTAIGGLIRKSGVCKSMKQFYINDDGTDGHAAVVSSVRIDSDITNDTIFSVADAKTAKLWGGKDNWAKYPKQMLMWRALSAHGRQFYGDVLAGFYTAEELHEVKPPDEQPTPQVQRRADRKPAADAVVKDTATIKMEALESMLGRFLPAVAEKFNVQLYPDKDATTIWEALSFTAAYLGYEEVNFADVASIDLCVITAIDEAVAQGNLPEALDAVLPAPFGEEPEPKPEADKEPMLIEDVEANAKEKLGGE